MRRAKMCKNRLFVSLLVLLCAIPSFANSNTNALYVLNTPNGQLSSSPGPYGTVALQLNSNGTITITVAMKSTFGIAGGGPAFGFNGPWGLRITGLSSGFSCCNPNGSGYGNFQYVITGPPPKSHAPTTLKFVVGIKGNGKFQSVSQLGSLFMAHVIPTNGKTGFATTRVTVADGDPSTVTLSILALVGCSLLRSKPTVA